MKKMTGQNITEIGWGMVAAGVIVVMGVAVNGFFQIPEILNGNEITTSWDF
ncbi:hypothetical protein ACEQPO_08440 [Bacillus sp. SL00103]